MPDPIAAEAARTCQAWDLGYPAECARRACWKADKHQALSFVLCSRHLYRARRAHYDVVQIGDAGAK
ncbi:hypothetical protein GCM10018965_049690 [Nonomuraea roseola]